MYRFWNIKKEILYWLNTLSNIALTNANKLERWSSQDFCGEDEISERKQIKVTFDTGIIIKRWQYAVFLSVFTDILFRIGQDVPATIREETWNFPLE